jgi:hypothetical protein
MMTLGEQGETLTQGVPRPPADALSRRPCRYGPRHFHHEIPTVGDRGWVIATVTLTATPPGKITCARCGSFLEPHQPDMGRPDDLVGTCLYCGVWHIISAAMHGVEILIVDRPAAGPPRSPT